MIRMKQKLCANMDKENGLPLSFKIIDKTIGYDLEGFNAKTGRFVHSMREGSEEFTDEEMEELQQKWVEMVRKVANVKCFT